MLYILSCHHFNIYPAETSYPLPEHPMSPIINWKPILANQFWAVVGFENYNMAHILTSSHLNWDVKWPGGVISLGPLKLCFAEEEREGWFNITKKITCPWQTMRLLGCEKTIQSCGICFQSCWTVFLFFTFYFHFFFTHFVWNYFSGQDEVRTSNLLHLSWDFLHSGLMLQQLSHLADWKLINFQSYNIKNWL